jgi:Holliday junction resolvase RusA-like endonuclease
MYRSRYTGGGRRKAGGKPFDRTADRTIAFFRALLAAEGNPAATYRFELEGNPVAKQRAQIARAGGRSIAYYQGGYGQWKEKAAWELRVQYREQGGLEPIARASGLFIELSGKCSRAQDGDNVEGGIWDALVQGGVLRNDNLNCIPLWGGRLRYDRKLPPRCTIVLLV